MYIVSSVTAKRKESVKRKIYLWKQADSEKLKEEAWSFHRVFNDSHFGSFYSQNLVLDLHILGARVLSDAYMINPNLISFINGFVCKSVCDLKGKNYQYLGNTYVVICALRVYSFIQQTSKSY